MQAAVNRASRSPINFTKTMLWIFLFGYSFFLVGQITFENYKMNRQIGFEKNKIKQLEQTNYNLQLASVYYNSSAFQEVEARQRLLLKGKDEHVVAMPGAKTEPTLAIATDSVINPPPKPAIPAYQAWWNLFFAKDDD